MDARDAESLCCGNWYVSFDQERMVFTILTWAEDNEDGSWGEEKELEIPAKWDIWGLCDGRGSHVNPGIDAGGLTAGDFAEDPGFAESYFRGTYDEPCYRCHGRTTEPVVDEDRCNPEQLKAAEETMSAHYESGQERAAEIKYGY